MFKKSLLIITIMVSGILSCCTDVIPYWNIDDFTIKFDDGTRNYVEEGTIISDSLIIQTDLEVDFLSDNWTNNPFINTAFAFSCEPDGHKGLKDKMTSITFTSNQDFNDIASGNSLNSLITLDNPEFVFLDTSLEKLPQQLNQTFFYYSNLEFVIKEKPTNNSTHQFTISMDFESGKNVTTTSKDITWE